MASALLALPATGLRLDRLERPLADRDLYYTYAQVRGHLEHGWYLRNGDLGWPYGQDLRLFPLLDQTHFAALKGLGLASADPLVVANAYYLLGFPLAGLAAYLFLRVTGARRWLAVPFAVSYAILPWHTDRAEHLFLSAYWVVPLGLALVLVVGTGRWDALLRRLAPGRRRAVTAAGVAAGVAVGLGGVYYALMLAVLVLVAHAVRGRRAWLGPSGWLTGTLAGTVLTSLVVAQVALDRATGPQDVGGATARMPGESEVYGGRLANLLLPWEGTPVLGGLRHGYDQDSLIGNPSTQHGVLAVLGTWLLLGLVLRLVLVRRRPEPTSALPWLAGLHLVMVFAFVATGLGALVAQVLPQLRGWDRYSVFVALLATAAVALVVQSLVARARRQGLALGLAVGLTSLVVVVDQAHPEVDLARPELAAALASARTALAEADAALGSDDCPVVQYPAIGYPEAGPVGDLTDYDMLLTYLAGSEHPLSYGAVKGSVAGDWSGQLDDRTAQAWTAQVAGVGFCAVEVLDAGLTSERERALAAGLQGVLGPPVAVDALNRRTWFDLSAAAERVRGLAPEAQAHLRDAALRPVQLALDPDSASAWRGSGERAFRWLTDDRGTLLLSNPSDVARTVTATVRLASPYADGTDRVTLAEQQVDVGTAPVTLTLTREVAARTTLRLPLTTSSSGVPGAGSRVFLAVYEPEVDFDRGPLGAPAP